MISQDSCLPVCSHQHPQELHVGTVSPEFSFSPLNPLSEFSIPCRSPSSVVSTNPKHYSAWALNTPGVLPSPRASSAFSTISAHAPCPSQCCRCLFPCIRLSDGLLLPVDCVLPLDPPSSGCRHTRGAPWALAQATLTYSQLTVTHHLQRLSSARLCSACVLSPDPAT